MLDRIPGPPRPRTFAHPGPFGAVRIETLCAGQGRHFRMALPTGSTLFSGIVDALSGAGVHNASMTLIDGELESLSFCLARADATRRVVAAYTPPQALRSARFIFGNATLGRSPSGAPVVHCHAVFRTDDGKVLGGHLLTERCIVGASSIKVVATTLDGFELRISQDAETLMPLMRPQPQEIHA